MGGVFCLEDGLMGVRIAPDALGAVLMELWAVVAYAATGLLFLVLGW